MQKKSRTVQYIAWVTPLRNIRRHHCYYILLTILLLTQNLVATKPGIQRITGITVFDTREKKSYEPMPDLEVSCSH